MKKKMLVWPLAFLFAWPSFACANPDGQKAAAPASFYCAAAKQIAAGYVVLLKEKYDGKPKDRQYIEAQLKYRLAAAKFAGLRATLELEAVGGSRIPNVNKEKYQPVVREALQAFDDFCSSAQRIVLAPEVQSSSASSLAPLNFATVITDIFSYISRFQELWVRHDAIRETRLKKLTEWLDEHFRWQAWEEIGVSKPEVQS